MPIPRKKLPKKIRAARAKQQEEERQEIPLDFFGLPQLREGESADILRLDSLVTITLPLNQFYLVWEVVETYAKKNEKYAGSGPMQKFGIAWNNIRSYFRHQFYSTNDGYAYFSRELGRYRLREEAAAAAKKTRKAPNAPLTPAKPAERATAATLAKKTRCTAEKKGVQCLGPAGHASKIHKGKLKGGRKVQWRDDVG